MSKFFFTESPAVADPVHPVIPIGPIQFGISCQPGALEGEVVLGFSTTIASPISWTTVATVSGTGEVTTSSVYDASTAVPVAPQTSLKFVKAKGRRDQTATFIIDASGFITWLQVSLGAVGGENSAPSHCYMSGIEI
ncbi:MAG: hypothetical protein M3Z95_07455 [Actinomycetota bacterium]|nr:hypothetical protein [Actinomycetota bacterium]